MRRDLQPPRFLLLGVGLLASACGGASATSDGGGTPPSDGGDPVDAAPPAQGLTFSLAPVTLMPGEEKLFCQYVPSDGKEHWINRFVTDLSPGSHHLVVFRVTDTTNMVKAYGPVDCINQQIPTDVAVTGMLPGGQQLHTDAPLPDGIAMKLGANEGLFFQEHYINATSAPITSHVSWFAGTVDAATVQQTAGMIFYSNYGLNVPPGMSQASMTCKAPGDLHLVTATGHMHQRGTAFDATVAGQNIYHTSNWDEPNGSLFPAPGYAVKMGDPISWTCSYDNTTTNTYTYGNSAINNEMCIFASIFYPSPNSATAFQCIQ